MKNIKISNGEIRIGYEFKDLSQEAKDKVLNEWVDMEIELMTEESPYYYLAEKMERMQTPWFLASEIYHTHKADLIETIEINDYLFTEDGEFLPIIHHTRTNAKGITETVKHTYGKKQLVCEITEP